jgi:uncharacterized membrane protein YfcA
MALDSSLVWFVTAVAALLIGLGKGGLGGLIGIFATAMLALVLPTENVIGLVLPLLIVGDVFTIAAHWRKWDPRLVLQLLPGGLIGVALATSILKSISGDELRLALGVIILVFVGYKLLEGRLLQSFHYQPRSIHGWLAGTVSGITSTLAHGGGPPVSIFLIMQNLAPQTFVATTALFILFLNWIKVPSYILSGLFDWKLINSSLWVVPLLPLGVFLGKWLVKRLDQGYFERLILILLGISGIFVLLR